ncbi:hypothetical protein M2360_005079 [Rhizobium sp. SG_E_25_P2]|uniref:hypothetical protein n=1 Tax=Rhizobium sp. SG_E_25_P2 TaxID=2879942 RepID=UPI002473C618|nr:hypothetical protein [Rhizobium sp. SG_E_25_P2]MDH6269651.1 hypothetical protein [Rhizobium sp. SG_E_25_P2]
MKLDEFVKQSLLDITNGVVEAQKQSMVYIAPGYVNGKRIEQAHDVKFEVSVTVSVEGGGGIKVLSFGELKAGANSENSSKLSFEVPIYFNAPTPRNPLHHSNNIARSEGENA